MATISFRSHFVKIQVHILSYVTSSCPVVSKHDDVIKWKHFPRYWSPVNSPHKGQWRGALMFSLNCVWINGWVNNREADDLRRYRTNYDVTVMDKAVSWLGDLPVSMYTFVKCLDKFHRNGYHNHLPPWGKRSLDIACARKWSRPALIQIAGRWYFGGLQFLWNMRLHDFPQ